MCRERKFGLLFGVSGAVLVMGLASTAAHAQAQPANATKVAPTKSSSVAPTKPSSEAIKEIVVTAERRSAGAQKVPISMSVFSSDFVRERMTDPFEIAKYTPNYQIDVGHGAAGASVSIRGVGNVGLGSDANQSRNVLTYYDGIPADKGTFAYIPPWDVDRIEVQRGPQGTLYGRNAVGGLVQYISAAPTEQLKGYTQVSAGEYGLRSFEGAIGGQVAPGIKVRLSGLIHDRGGDIQNTYFNIKQGDQHWYGIRGIVDWSVTSRATLRLKAQYFNRKTIDLAMNAAPGSLMPPTTQAWLAASGANPDLSRESNFSKTQVGLRDPYSKDKSNIYEADFNYDFGPVLLTAVGGYVKAKMDYDNLPADYPVLLFHDRTTAWTRQTTGELRLTSQNPSPFQWILGGYYQSGNDRTYHAVDETSFVRDINCNKHTRYNPIAPGDEFDGILPVVCAPNYASISDSRNRLKTAAIFLHTTYNWTDRLKTTHALRYSDERLIAETGRNATFAFPVSPGVVPGTLAQNDDFYRFAELTPDQQRQVALKVFSDAIVPRRSRNWKVLTWKFGVEYQVTPAAMLYANVSKGFKGGYLTSTASADPEKAIVYEAGAKTDWFNHRLRVNAAAFYNDYIGFQTPLFVLRPNGTFFQSITNLPKSKIYGGELEVTAVPTRDLFISANIGVLNSKITKVPPGNEMLLGNKIPFTEDLNFSGIARYDIHTQSGVISPEVDVRRRGKFWSLKENNDVLGEQGGFWTADARIGFKSNDGLLYGSFWVKNVFNTVKPVLEVTNPSAFSVFATTLSYFNERRSWGVTLGRRF